MRCVIMGARLRDFIITAAGDTEDEEKNNDDDNVWY